MARASLNAPAGRGGRGGAAAAGARAGGGRRADDDSDEEESDEDDEEDVRHKNKGVAGLIEVHNPNLVANKAQKASTLGARPTQELSRRERYAPHA